MAKSKGLNSRPIKRESRPTGIERLSECQLGGDTLGNSITATQVQFLIGLKGVRPALAPMLAQQIWGSFDGGNSQIGGVA